jgi:hypothetical protein
MSAIDKLFDENNNDNIVLYNENGDATEFEQVAIIPNGGKIYALLSLATPTEDISEDEGFVFSIETTEEGKKTLNLVTDDGVIDAVFKVYEDLLDELEESDDFFDDEPEDLLDEILADLDDEE